MTSILWDIEAELVTAACGKPRSAVERLVSLGCDRRFVAQLNEDFGPARVALHADGTFAIGGPDQRLLLGVREAGGLVDVLALSSTCRDEWAVRTGLATMLGWDLWLEAQLGQRRRLRVFATPLDWLAGHAPWEDDGSGGPGGICVLDWSAEALGMLRGLGESVTLTVDPGAKDRMKGLLAYGGLPRVEAAPRHHLRGMAA